MFKGWFGERKTQFNLWFSLNKELYRRFHDVIIPSDNGTTQVDHVLVSPFGLFIVETKNLKGWIYGSESQSKWTQVVYKNKYSFQNPLKQTYKKNYYIFMLVIGAIIENIGYRQLKTVWRLIGLIKFAFNSKFEWGVMKSQGKWNSQGN